MSTATLGFAPAAPLSFGKQFKLQTTSHPSSHPKNSFRWRKITATLSKDVDIASVGNLCLDIILPIADFPVRPGMHQRLSVGSQLELGGSLNALISAQRLGARAAPVAYISQPGPDITASDALISQYLVDQAARVGLDTSALVRRSGVIVPTCAALFDRSGTHTFLASNELPQRERTEGAAAPESMLGVVRRSKALIVDGFALHSDRQLVRETVTVAGVAGTAVWVDPQSATQSLSSTKDELFGFVMECAKGVSLTAEESFVLTATENPTEAAKIMSKKWCPSAEIFLIKDGEKGCYVVSITPDTRRPACHSVDGFEVNAGGYKDSIGAGDSFLGAFLAGLFSQKLSTLNSAMLANAMGAATCLQHGAGVSGVGTGDSVDAFLQGTPLSEVLPTLLQ